MTQEDPTLLKHHRRITLGVIALLRTLILFAQLQGVSRLRQQRLTRQDPSIQETSMYFRRASNVCVIVCVALKGPCASKVGRRIPVRLHVCRGYAARISLHRSRKALPAPQKDFECSRAVWSVHSIWNPSASYSPDTAVSFRALVCVSLAARHATGDSDGDVVGCLLQSLL